MSLFLEGINQINENHYFGPTEFLQYCKDINFKPKGTTAQYISLDFYEKLPKELKENEAMVLRMGGGQKTNFVLFKTDNSLKNFFLDDESIFSNLEPRTFMPKVEMRELIPYYLMPTRSETTFVNFALSTGVFHKALGLDGNTKITMPATGKSTFTFDVKVHSSIDHVFQHNSGQVEIDGIFLGQKNGEDCLFVLEAKNKDSNTTLSKHKLVYPILSIGNSVPLDIKIVPVYMKSIEHKEFFEFKIAECFYEDPRTELKGIDELKVVEKNIFRVPKINL